MTITAREMLMHHVDFDFLYSLPPKYLDRGDFYDLYMAYREMFKTDEDLIAFLLVSTCTDMLTCAEEVLRPDVLRAIAEGAASWADALEWDEISECIGKESGHDCTSTPPRNP